jgi:hypothetical protein
MEMISYEKRNIIRDAKQAIFRSRFSPRQKVTQSLMFFLIISIISITRACYLYISTTYSRHVYIKVCRN